MGSSWSKATSWATGTTTDSNKNLNSDNKTDPKRFSSTKKLATPFVYARRSSLLVDEDGDTAHEFYEEVKTGRSKSILQKTQKNLKPQGEVLYPIPRLHADFPVVMFEEKPDKQTTDRQTADKQSKTKT